MIVDRIVEAPSEWQMCLTPLMLWLSVHIDDGLFQAVLARNGNLQTEFARLHELVAEHCKRA